MEGCCLQVNLMAPESTEGTNDTGYRVASMPCSRYIIVGHLIIA
jgi:hypothetical protein